MRGGGGGKKSRIDSVLCHCTVVLWLMLDILEAEAFPSELPPAGCLAVGWHCPAHLHGRRGNSTAGVAALTSLSQRSILSGKGLRDLTVKCLAGHISCLKVHGENSA